MTSENQKRVRALSEELSSYLYGIAIILGFASVMLLIHLSLDFFFHN